MGCTESKSILFSVCISEVLCFRIKEEWFHQDKPKGLFPLLLILTIYDMNIVNWG